MASSAPTKAAGKALLGKAGKRDPELYALFAVMCGIFSVAGYYFGRNPTAATSENSSVAIAGVPWEQDGKTTKDYKYKYHPGANPANPPKEAPSALHSVVVPNVNLPKELHDKYNKWGKEGF